MSNCRVSQSPLEVLPMKLAKKGHLNLTLQQQKPKHRESKRASTALTNIASHLCLCAVLRA
jgi:hypothetical protein